MGTSQSHDSGHCECTSHFLGWGIAGKFARKILDVLEMYWVSTCPVHYPFPCSVLAMYRHGTLPLVPSVSRAAQHRKPKMATTLADMTEPTATPNTNSSHPRPSGPGPVSFMGFNVPITIFNQISIRDGQDKPRHVDEVHHVLGTTALSDSFAQYFKDRGPVRAEPCPHSTFIPYTLPIAVRHGCQSIPQ